MKDQYSNLIIDLKEEWKDHKGKFSFKVKGYQISGTLEIGSKDIKIEGEIPWALSFFKGKIEKILIEKVHDLLA